MGVSVYFTPSSKYSLWLYLAFVSVLMGKVQSEIEKVETLSGRETEIITGLLYTIHNVQLDGIVTYVRSDNRTSNIGEMGHNILVLRNSMHKSGSQYQPGERFENSTFFYFQKHSDRYYKLINVALRGPVTYKAADLMPKNRLNISDDTLVVADFNPVGYRNVFEDASTFGLVDFNGGFKLFLKELNAPVTYDPAENAPTNIDGSRDTWLVVRSVNSSIGNHYLPGGRWENSTQFKISKVKPQFLAEISNFTYDDTNFQQELATDHPGVSESIMNCTNEKYDQSATCFVNETKHFHNSVVFRFNHSATRHFINQNVEARILASLDFIPGSVNKTDFAKWSTQRVPIDGKKYVESDLTELQALATLEMNSRERVETKALWIPIEVEVPFTASATVRARVNPANGEGTEGLLLDSNDVLEELVAWRNLKYKVTEDGNGIVLELSGTVNVRRAMSPFAIAVYHNISKDDPLTPFLLEPFTN